MIDCSLKNPAFSLPKIFLLGCLLFLFGFQSYSQVKPSLGGSSRLMNSALAEMEKGDFERANAYFRQIIESNLPIPSEMPYFFAETLFQLGQFDNSSSFLEKYLEINGYQGDNYEQAKILQQKLKNHLDEISNCKFCDFRGYRYNGCPTCNGNRILEQSCSFCKAKGVVGCIKCMGKGLVTKKNIFNIIEYHECDKCGGDGRLDCPRCTGSLVEVSDCRTCRGQGRLISEEICNHQAEPRNMSQKFERLRHLAGH